MKALQADDIQRWWQTRPGREKLMLGACSLGVVLALGDSLVVTPTEKRLRMARASEDQLQSRLVQDHSRKVTLATVDHDMLAQEQQLRQRLEAAQARAGRMQVRLGEAAQLPDTLRSLVATMGSAKLLELALADDNASAVAKTATTAPNGSDAAAPGSRPVYRLPITLKVSGSWSELADLLAKIEAQAPSLQWQQFTLDSSDWPAIQLTLKAHVASLQPRWGTSS